MELGPGPLHIGGGDAHLQPLRTRGQVAAGEGALLDAALEGFAQEFGLRQRKALLGFPSPTRQELVYLYDPRITSYNVCYTKLLRMASATLCLPGVRADSTIWR